MCPYPTHTLESAPCTVYGSSDAGFIGKQGCQSRRTTSLDVAVSFSARRCKAPRLSLDPFAPFWGASGREDKVS